MTPFEEAIYPAQLAWSAIIQARVRAGDPTVTMKERLSVLLELVGPPPRPAKHEG